MFPPNLLMLEPLNFFHLIPFKFKPTNFNTLLNDSIETHYQYKFGNWSFLKESSRIIIDYRGFGETFSIKSFLMQSLTWGFGKI